MSITNIDEFNHQECEKLDANKVNAYVDFHLDEENPTGLCLDTSWGGDCLDLKSIVKAGETVTTLHLAPEGAPSCLVFEREDGQSDCIHGDDLSRIISMAKLKDVDQNTPPRNGDVYMYSDGKFYTFNLKEFVDYTNGAISTLTQNLNALRSKVEPMLNRWFLPNDIPDNAKIALSNINLYSDHNAVINSDGSVQSLDKSSGIYGHKLSEERLEDELFG